ncbi:MAG: hypothetical protein ABI570_03760, partial [Ilumatobacteraceae bacterium]
MHVNALVTDDPALTDTVDANLALRKSQWFGIGALVVLLIALTVILFRNADNSVKDLKVLADDASLTSNIILTQHESLQFASSFDRWLSGTTTRANLDIRRSELTEKLAAIDNNGVPTQEHLTDAYLDSLRTLDSYLIGTPNGSLPPDQQVALRASSQSDLNMFIMLASEMTPTDSNGSIDPLETLFQKEIVRQNSRNAALLVALTLIFLVAGFIAFTHLRDLKKVRKKMEIEREKLDESNVAIKQIDDELQLRLNQERIDRAESEWINTTVRSISLEFKSTIVPDTIAESLV